MARTTLKLNDLQASMPKTLKVIEALDLEWNEARSFDVLDCTNTEMRLAVPGTLVAFTVRRANATKPYSGVLAAHMIEVRYNMRGGAR